MKIRYVTGSRADFGLMQNCLAALAACDDFDVQVVMTGQALLPRYGAVEDAVLGAGLSIANRIPVSLEGQDGFEMALALGDELRGMAAAWHDDRPDLVLLLGDRGEMLAAALAAYHLEIPIAHLHGGERSGSLDESFRHAISKLATFHLPATEDAKERLVRLGERPDRIWVVGAPGLSDLPRPLADGPSWLAREFGLQPNLPAALVVFHPVVQEQENAFEQTRALLTALRQEGLQAIIVRPNSDAGGAEIDRCLATADPSFKIFDNLDRQTFLHVMAAVDLLVGNSSSGIVESASLGTACVNLGSRQQFRLRNDNIVDCPEFELAAIRAAIALALELRPPFHNQFGDGTTCDILPEVIRALPLSARAPAKSNTY